ncbi:hypothetical protein G6F35_015957 [Rhizopus arrhizus]|nr:hypothetical protein G6F35_015957 [Rhizopus arrhizus]
MDILQSGVPYRAIAGPVAQRIAPGQPSCRDMRGGGQSRGPWAGEVVCRTIAVTDVAAVVTDDRILVVRGAEVVLVVGRRRAAVGPVQRQQARGAGSAELQAAQGAHGKADDLRLAAAVVAPGFVVGGQRRIIRAFVLYPAAGTHDLPFHCCLTPSISSSS